MQLTKDSSDAQYQIKKYAPGCITVNNQDYTNSILIMPNYFSAWDINHIQDLQLEQLQHLMQFQPDVILIGAGEKLVFPKLNTPQIAAQYKVGIEIMTSAAACRTYTILVAEQRNVLAALIV